MLRRHRAFYSILSSHGVQRKALHAEEKFGVQIRKSLDWLQWECYKSMLPWKVCSAQEMHDIDTSFMAQLKTGMLTYSCLIGPDTLHSFDH